MGTRILPTTHTPPSSIGGRCRMNTYAANGDGSATLRGGEGYGSRQPLAPNTYRNSGGDG